MATSYGYIFSRKLMFTKLSFRKIVRYYIKSSDIVDDWYVIDKIILVINTIIVCRSKKMVSEIVSTLLFFVDQFSYLNYTNNTKKIDI